MDGVELLTDGGLTTLGGVDVPAELPDGCVDRDSVSFRLAAMRSTSDPREVLFLSEMLADGT